MRLHCWKEIINLFLKTMTWGNGFVKKLKWSFSDFFAQWFERSSDRKRFCRKLWTSENTSEFWAKFRKIGRPKTGRRSAASADIFSKANIRNWSKRCRRFWRQIFWKFPALNQKILTVWSSSFGATHYWVRSIYSQAWAEFRKLRILAKIFSKYFCKMAFAKWK